jgi:SAM-dependent methyltransferase
MGTDSQTSSRRGAPPERLVVAIERLDVQPNDRILEIGGGRGVAAELICQRLRGGQLVGIDRSEKAVAAASARNAEAVASGTARFLTLALEDVDPGELGPGSFDKVLAVNVNLFWTRPAERELGLIAALLRPGGRLHLCYDPPDAKKLARLQGDLTARLAAAGYDGIVSTVHAATGGPALFQVAARLPASS